MKRIRILLVLALALCLLYGSALAEGGASWSYDTDNFYLKVNGEMSGDVTIPAEVDGCAVTALKYNAFVDQHGVTSLTMPDSMRALQNGAIGRMDGLTSVTLNDGLAYIGSNFVGCDALTSLTIPASVRIIDGAIWNCASLREIRFEGPCPIFMNTDWCFSMMPEDYTIYVPDDQLVAYAAALAHINGAASHLAPSGRNAVMPAKENMEDWFVFDASTGTITGYTGFHAFVEVPGTIGGVAVKAIGAHAFDRDYSLYGIVLPEGLETVGEGAFRQASNLCYIHFPSTLKTIGDEAFFNTQSSLIEWNEGLETIGARAFQYDRSPVLTLPSTLKSIGDSAFEGASCLELHLGGRVEHIGARAFAGTALYYVMLDAYTVIDIAPDAFANTSLADLDLPWDSSPENRDAYAALLREQCPNCTVWINNPISGGVAEYPENRADVTTIADGVWTAYHGDAADLTVWTSYDRMDVTALGDGLFKGNQSIRSFYPHHCGWFTTIGNEAFADSSVAYVELFGSITTIGEGAFRNCVNITELTLPASLTSIGKGALDGCTGLTKLTVLCDPAILPADLTANCPALTEVYAAPDATDGQVRALSAIVGYPWYSPVPRVGEQRRALLTMPDASLPGDDFWYDGEYSRLDRYNGYELNLILPQEIDGVRLTTIGGTMMSRASSGDNFDVELPVVSLVIPEGYTEIVPYAFANCDTLETVICYAPIETLPEGCFSECASLREVVFVNGVRNVDRNAFAGCFAMETLYLGGCVESIDTAALLDAYGVEAFTLTDCLTETLPDVAALLDAVRCGPMPAEPDEPEIELVAQPVGAEGEPFLGVWNAQSMDISGEILPLAAMGVEMRLTLNADGTAELYDGEEAHVAVWTVAEGIAMVDGTAAALTEDGTLRMEEDGVAILFRRDAEAAGAAVPAMPDVTEPAASDPIDLSARYGCRYVMASADVQGVSMTPAMLGGLEYSLVFGADGTVVFTIAGTPVSGLTWTQGTADGQDALVIDYYGLPMYAVITEEGFDMNYFDAMLIHFVAE
ncbi:MAG: leucine-rich repeat protein [Aristaeellaceae bacterium]